MANNWRVIVTFRDGLPCVMDGLTKERAIAEARAIALAGMVERDHEIRCDVIRVRWEREESTADAA